MDERPWRTQPLGQRPFKYFNFRTAPIRLYGLISPLSLGNAVAYPLLITLAGCCYLVRKHRKQEYIRLHKDPSFHTILTEEEFLQVTAL
jgi:hypothetical protein